MQRAPCPFSPCSGARVISVPRRETARASWTGAPRTHAHPARARVTLDARRHEERRARWRHADARARRASARGLARRDGRSQCCGGASSGSRCVVCVASHISAAPASCIHRLGTALRLLLLRLDRLDAFSGGSRRPCRRRVQSRDRDLHVLHARVDDLEQRLDRQLRRVGLAQALGPLLLEELAVFAKLRPPIAFAFRVRARRVNLMGAARSVSGARIDETPNVHAAALRVLLLRARVPHDVLEPSLER